MKPETLTALKESIEKHEKNLEAETPDYVRLGAYFCPLCWMFNASKSECDGCPVHERTKCSCAGSPYEDLVLAKRDWENGRLPRDAFLEAEQKEIDFLKSLLPEGEV